MDVRDDLDRPLPIGAPPQRVVSLVPSLTESLFDLGAGARVVGVTRYCDPALPAGARPAPVGGVHDPDIDRIRALEPGLVVACREENRRDHVEALERGGIPVFVAVSRDVARAADTVRRLGRALGLAQRADESAAAIDGSLAAVRARLAGQPHARVIYPIWHRPPMTVGGRSYAAAVLRDAGAIVVGAAAGDPSDPGDAGEPATGGGDYPRLDLALAAAADPSHLLLPDEPFDFHGAAGEALAEELARAHPGAPRPRAVEVDGRWAAWYGTRSGQRLDALARLLHPARTPR